MPNRRLGPFSIAAGLWSTISVARKIVSAGKKKDQSELYRFASSAAISWSNKILSLVKANVSIDGIERVGPQRGPRIFLFTHKSFLDVALIPFLLASLPREKSTDEPICLPRFLVARDHFRDNVLLYRFLGIGKMAERLGMIFVDRKSKDRAAFARKITEDAVTGLVRDRVPLAIFPQGTRAWPHFGPKGERLESAYYTVGPPERIAKEGAHLKKGAAHIAVSTAQVIAGTKFSRPVEIIPVAILGSAIACPRGSFRIKPNVNMRLCIGVPIIIGPESLDKKYADAVLEIHSKIDVSLKTAEHCHAELERRFFESLRGRLKPMEFEDISIAMKSWRNSDYLLFAILDAIYTCKSKEWIPLTGELAHLILNYCTREEMLEFKKRVANTIGD